MYVAVLSETGIVGLLLFLGMLGVVLRDLFKAVQCKNEKISTLAKNWLVVAVLVLLAGITKQDHYDKLTWIVIGIGVGIHRMSLSVPNEQPR